MKYTKLINASVFRYIWNANYDPLKRDTLYKKRDEGGIGLFNIYVKAKSIFVSTNLKVFLNARENSMSKYYLALKINNILKINIMPRNVTLRTTPYYEYFIDALKLTVYNKDFPNVNSRNVYEMLMPKNIPKIENEYPLYNWKNIWCNISFKYINVNDKPIIFKYIHEILPNNKRLYQCRLKDNPNCIYCNIEDSNIHRFYYCSIIQNCIK